MPNSCAQHISHAGTTNWGGTAAGRTREALLLSTALQKSGQSDPCSCPRLHYHLFFIYQSVGHGRERVRAATSLHSWSRCAAIGVRKAATHLAPCTARTWRSSDTHCRQRPRMCPAVPPMRPRPRQRPLAPTEPLCTAHKNTVPSRDGAAILARCSLWGTAQLILGRFC